MSFPGFYSLAGAWLFLLIIPLVVFYFLKLKRPRMEIPSLALWRQVINDRRVNSPFQKFKRNLLLLLQLLVLLFLILAAMQPFVQSQDDRAQNLPVLIDCSASMAALDKPGGKSRLDAAKDQVRELIDNMLPDQRLTLVAVHSTARRLTDFTDNKRVLHSALEKITVLDVPSKLEDALRMTQALSRTVAIEKVLIYSDGNFSRQVVQADGTSSAQVDFELPFELNYQQLPMAGANVGVTAFNARRSGPDKWDVFVQIEWSQGGQTSVDVELYNGDELMTDRVLEPGESLRPFSVETEKAASLEIRLKPTGFDSLASDNVAYLELPVARPLSVYCPVNLATYRHALRHLKGIVLYPDEDGSGTAPGYDLAITDQQQAAGALESTVTYYVGVVPDELQKLVTVKTGLAEIVDWVRTSGLLQHMRLTDVQIADQPTSNKGVQASDYEQLGYQILAHGATGPLILKKRRGQKLAFYLLFHTDRSTLPYRIGFPILVANSVQVAMDEADLSEVRGSPTRILPARSLLADREYQVRGPHNLKRTVKSNSDGVVSGVAAPYVGRYVISEGSRDVARIGASLLDSTESTLVSASEIQFRELSVSAAETRVKSDRPLWPILAVIAFCFLLVEWWYFQRRPGGAGMTNDEIRMTKSE